MAGSLTEEKLGGEEEHRCLSERYYQRKGRESGQPTTTALATDEKPPMII